MYLICIQSTIELFCKIIVYVLRGNKYERYSVVFLNGLTLEMCIRDSLPPLPPYQTDFLFLLILLR